MTTTSLTFLWKLSTAMKTRGPGIQLQLVLTTKTLQGSRSSLYFIICIEPYIESADIDDMRGILELDTESGELEAFQDLERINGSCSLLSLSSLSRSPALPPELAEDSTKIEASPLPDSSTGSLNLGSTAVEHFANKHFQAESSTHLLPTTDDEVVVPPLPMLRDRFSS